MTALLHTLQSLIEQRLSSVAKDIFMDVERIITELEEFRRQHTLQHRQHPAELSLLSVCKEEEPEPSLQEPEPPLVEPEPVAELTLEEPEPKAPLEEPEPEPPLEEPGPKAEPPIEEPEPEPIPEEAEPPRVKQEEQEELLLRPVEADRLTLTLSHWNENLDALSVSVNTKTLSRDGEPCSTSTIEMLEAREVKMLEATEAIRAIVLSALPRLPVEVLDRVVERLVKHGARKKKDLHYVTQEDLEGLMTPIQCRKLLRTSHPDRKLESHDVIRTRVLSALPNLPVEVLGRVVERLMEHGAETEEDLLYVTEENLEGLMKPIQCRKLLRAWIRPEPPRQMSPLDQSASVSTRSCTSLPPLSRWPENFKVNWAKMPNNLLTALRSGKRPSPVDRRDMVRVIVNDLQRIAINPRRAECFVVTRNIVDQYPKSFDLDSLLTQIQARIYHVNRNNPLAHHRKRKIPESKDSLESKRQMLTELYSSGMESADVIKLMETTFSLQRQMINANPAPPLSDVKQQWPYLFLPKGMCAHFERLMKVPILQQMEAFLKKRGSIIVEFFIRNPTNDAVKAVLDRTECSVTATNILQLLMAHFKEPLDALVIQTDESATPAFVQMTVPLVDSPRLVVACPLTESNQRWMLSIQKQVLCEGTSFLVGLAVLFSSYYNFSLQYQHNAACTLEFIQRCCIDVWPWSDTKASQEMMVQNKTSVNPHVSELLEKLSNADLYLSVKRVT